MIEIGSKDSIFIALNMELRSIRHAYGYVTLTPQKFMNVLVFDTHRLIAGVDFFTIRKCKNFR